jgi:hypothetical protein
VAYCGDKTVVESWEHGLEAVPRENLPSAQLCRAVKRSAGVQEFTAKVRGESDSEKYRETGGEP